MSTSEKDWQAESDARTLTEAEVIKSDEKRMGAAQKAAKRIQEEEEIRATAMKKIAGAKMDYSKSMKD